MKIIITTSIVVISLFFVMHTAISAPYIPDSNNEVLLVLDKNSQRSRFEDLHNKLVALENQPDKLLNVLQQTYQYGKEYSDPRYIGFVASFIDNYLKKNDNIKIKILKANILQHDHKFEQATRLLNSIIKNNPRELNARLLRASVSMVQANYTQARQDCYSLLGKTSHLITISCIAQVDGLTKDTIRYYATLKNIINVSKSSSALSWSYDILAQLAMQLGKFKQAELHYKQGLKSTPDNIALLNSYADLLIKNNEFSEVITLLKNKKHDFTVLLRLAIAEKNSSSSIHYKTLFQSRLQKMLTLLDYTHQREIAAFYLFVENNTKTALYYATRNWNQQKELYDALLLLKSAQANKNKTSMLTIKKWYLTNSITDIRLKEIINNSDLLSEYNFFNNNKNIAAKS